MQLTVNGRNVKFFDFVATHISRFIKEPYHNRYKITICVKTDKELNNYERECILDFLQDALNGKHHLNALEKAEEIEKLKACNERQRKTIKAYHIGKIRAEVAREIFAEIDKLYEQYGFFNTYRYAELKKKYTEGINEKNT